MLHDYASSVIATVLPAGILKQYKPYGAAIENLIGKLPKELDHKPIKTNMKQEKMFENALHNRSY